MISCYRPVILASLSMLVLLSGCANLPGMKQDAVTAELSAEKPVP